MDILKKIDDERKLKGLSWADLAEGLPVQGNSLRVAFKRGNVEDVYLNHIQNILGLNSGIESSVNEPSEKYEVGSPNKKQVPVYDIEVTSSVLTSFSDLKEIPSFYMDYEPFNDCDAVVTNWGDSMFPAYKNGERLAVKRYMNLTAVTWGETFLVITDSEANDLKTVKRVYQDEDNDENIILRASNPQFKGDTVIPKRNILALYAVKGKISQNFI